MSAQRDASSASAAWIEKVAHDLFAAEHLASLGDVAPLDVVCFHAQQCVEKCLKAVPERSPPPMAGCEIVLARQEHGNSTAIVAAGSERP